jgi:hypothetical protein
MGCHPERSEGSQQLPFSIIYEQLQGCFATLSITDFDFFTASERRDVCATREIRQALLSKLKLLGGR